MIDSMVIEPVYKAGVVSLKVTRAAAETARERLHLATPLTMTLSDPVSLWVGPNHWLLLSTIHRASEIIEQCGSSLEGVVHNAVDYSSALCGYSLSGGSAREVLATGTGVDLRKMVFTSMCCLRTRVFQIPTIIATADGETLEAWIERSHADWFEGWLREALYNALHGS